MSDEIIRQEPGITIYRTTDWGPAIPYPGAERDISTNHGFFDLRDKPELVEHVPEAASSSGLQTILRALNGPNSPLMSLGCERRLNPRDNSVDGGPNCYIHSYTDIAFRDPARNHAEASLIDLAEGLTSRIPMTPDITFTLELGIERLRHFFGHQGYGLQFGLSGYGVSEDEAVVNYERAALRVASAIADYAGAYCQA